MPTSYLDGESVLHLSYTLGGGRKMLTLACLSQTPEIQGPGSLFNTEYSVQSPWTPPYWVFIQESSYPASRAYSDLRRMLRKVTVPRNP